MSNAVYRAAVLKFDFLITSSISIQLNFDSNTCIEIESDRFRLINSLVERIFSDFLSISFYFPNKHPQLEIRLFSHLIFFSSHFFHSYFSIFQIENERILLEDELKKKRFFFLG